MTRYVRISYAYIAIIIYSALLRGVSGAELNIDPKLAEKKHTQKLNMTLIHSYTS